MLFYFLFFVLFICYSFNKFKYNQEKIMFFKKLIIIIISSIYLVKCNKCCNKTVLKKMSERFITDLINDYKLKFPSDSSFSCSNNTNKSLNNLIKCELIKIKLDLNDFWINNNETNNQSKLIYFFIVIFYF
jgi:hypothetical protein